MKKIILLSAALLISFISSYAQTKEIYTNPEFAALSKEHKTLAILPFTATVTLRPKQMRGMTPEQLEDLQRSEGKAVQSALHSYFLKQKGKQKFTVDFQDIGKTNAILAKNDIDQDNLETFTSEELAALLGVDGVVGGHLSTNKPMSDGASAALGLLVGIYGPTNSGKCTININDGNGGALLWKYEKTLSRSFGSDTNTVINTIMRKASRKFPYIRNN